MYPYNNIDLQKFPENDKNFSGDLDLLLRLFENPTHFSARLSVFMSKHILEFCAIQGIFIDEGGVILLQKFLKKFIYIWRNKKKITLEKLQEIFKRIYHKNKQYSQTKENVLLAGDIAVGLCFGIFYLNMEVSK